MTVTATSFRADFPEFADAVRYPDPMLAFWIKVAGSLLNAERWQDALDYGTELFVAHNATLHAKRIFEAANGAPPGINTGPINSKSVDKVSVGYDTGAASLEDAGFWNLTTYGTQFYQLANWMGAGPTQLGIGMPPVLDATFGASFAYGGPWPFNFPNPSGSG